VVANFVVTCQTTNLNILAAMTSFKKMIFALEVIRDQEGAFEQSFPEFQAQVAADVKKYGLLLILLRFPVG
jgi:hypothetical protein